MATMNNATDLSKRLVVETAFLDYCRLFSITEADIDLLYEKISNLNKLEKNEDLDIVVAYQLDTIHNKEELRSRIKEIRNQTAQKIFDPNKLPESISNVIKVTMTSVGISKEIAQKLTTAIAEHSLDEPFDNKKSMADKLYDVLQEKQKTLKEKLAADYETYKKPKVSNVVIQDIEKSICEHLSGMDRKRSLRYTTLNEDEPFRNKIRDIYSSPQGIRSAFLKLYGTMMENGKNLAQKTGSVSNFDAFCKQMEQMFGENAQSEIDRALGFTPQTKSLPEQKQERERLYAAKCQEIYFKTMAGILSHKIEFDRAHGYLYNDYTNYIQNINTHFIAGLRSGKTDIRSLAFADPKEDYSKKPEEEQIVSVHHKLPVGSARDVFRELFGKKDEKQELVGASSLVNTLGNMSLIIGQKTHASLEARGNYIVTAQDDNMIFASRIDKSLLTDNTLKIPPYLKDGIKKYALNSIKNGMIKIEMNFPEAQEMQKMRKELKAPSIAANIIDKFKQFWEVSPAK